MEMLEGLVEGMAIVAMWCLQRVKYMQNACFTKT